MSTKKTLFLIIYTSITLLFSNISYAADNSYYKNKQNKEYRSALRLLWTKVYPSKGKSLYCNQTFSTRNYKERKKHINAEHVFPMSWAANHLGCGKRKQCQKKSAKFRGIESDLHNIYPAKITINYARSNFKFGNVAGEKRKFGKCDFEINRKKRIAEPQDSTRGRIARSMLYMNKQYGLPLHKKTAVQMKKWNKKYPPKKEEIRRAKIIEKEQGRENKFVTRYPYSG